MLQKQRVEISRATAAFTRDVPVKTVAAAARWTRRAWWTWRRGTHGEWRRSRRVPQAPTHGDAEFPAGSYIIRMDQPYSRIADALLDYQYWCPNDPQKNPYDDTGWTFPEGFAVQAVRVTDHEGARRVPMQPVTGEIKRAGRRDGQRQHVPHQRERRQRARDAALQAQGRRHPGGRRAVRRERHSSSSAARSSSRASASRDLDAGDEGTRPQGRRRSRARRR